MKGWVTLGHAWKNRSHLENLVTLRKLVTLKNESHLEQLVALKNMGHTWKNGSHVENWLTLGKMGDTWINVLHLEKTGHTWKNGSVEKNGSHLKWFTFTKKKRVTLSK